MITLDSILENIIAEIIVLGLGFLVAKFIPKLVSTEDANKTKQKFDFLPVAIFLTLVSGANLILNISFWNVPQLTIFFSFLLIASGSLTYYVYYYQCPSCKKFIRARKRIDEKIIKKFTRPWKYQHKKIWLYSNGEIWKTKPIGKEKTRIEYWVTKQHFYECRYCHHHWDSGHFDVNLDKDSRPNPEYIQTDKRDPNSPF